MSKSLAQKLNRKAQAAYRTFLQLTPGADWTQREELAQLCNADVVREEGLKLLYDECDYFDEVRVYQAKNGDLVMLTYFSEYSVTTDEGFWETVFSDDVDWYRQKMADQERQSREARD